MDAFTAEVCPWRRLITTGVTGNMAERREQIHRSTVVVIDADSAYRRALADALLAAGLSVVDVDSVAELEQWPIGQVVVTDAAHLTPWWRLVGATEVIVLVRDPEGGAATLEKGATRRLQPPPAVEVVAAMVLAFTRGSSREPVRGEDGS